MEDESIESRKDEFDNLLLQVMKKAQSLDGQPQYIKPIPFPKLPELSDEDTLSIINKISSGKAIAYDGISDMMFAGNEKCKKKTASKLKDLWSQPWEEHIENENHFRTRLIPLNKVHPKLPKANQFRPISISSPLVKLLEARLSPKLSDYMTNGLHKGQTGFVPGMGILVNQMRLIEQVTKRTSEGRKAYGLFIDFSNAYNTILHTKLYERLDGILEKDEIQLIKAIYSRQQITIGKHQFNPNVGVAQGSIISPSLFNIYSEDLYKKLERDASINYQDLMGYADDLLVMCDSKHQLTQVIKAIREWSVENNLALNDSKSGIVEFFSRGRKTKVTLDIGSEFEGIPVVVYYKYLGMWVDGKLTMDRQIEAITNKANWMVIKLWHLLRKVSLSYRINLWTVLIRPLFEQITMLYYTERSPSNKEMVRRALRQTFKKFAMLKKNIKSEIIEDLMRFDIDDRANRNMTSTKRKWAYRTGEDIQESDVEEPEERKYRILPKELQELLNLMTAQCPKCVKGTYTVCNVNHMRETHQIILPTYGHIIEEIERRSEAAKAQGLSRRSALEHVSSFLTVHIVRMKKHLDIQNT